MDEKQKPEPGQTETKLKVGLLIKVYLKREAQWGIERIEGRFIGEDGVTRGYKVLAANGNLLVRPVQLVADLEVGGKREK